VGYPAFQVEGDRAVRQDPLAVVFARQVHVRAGGLAALTGGVADVIAGLEVRPGCHAPDVANVQVEDHPTSLFVAVPIQVEQHLRRAGTRYHPVGGGGDPLGGGLHSETPMGAKSTAA